MNDYEYHRYKSFLKTLDAFMYYMEDAANKIKQFGKKLPNYTDDEKRLLLVLKEIVIHYNEIFDKVGEVISDLKVMISWENDHPLNNQSLNELYTEFKIRHIFIKFEYTEYITNVVDILTKDEKFAFIQDLYFQAQKLYRACVDEYVKIRGVIGAVKIMESQYTH